MILLVSSRMWSKLRPIPGSQRGYVTASVIHRNTTDTHGKGRILSPAYSIHASHFRLGVQKN